MHFRLLSSCSAARQLWLLRQRAFRRRIYTARLRQHLHRQPDRVNSAISKPEPALTSPYSTMESNTEEQKPSAPVEVNSKAQQAAAEPTENRTEILQPSALLKDTTKAQQASPLEENNTEPPQPPSPPRPFIVRFYGEEGARDAERRALDDILRFNDRQLEYHHDYIQVLFPLPERSPINPDAPIIKKPVREAFLQNEDLRKNLFTAFKRMANFYAFDVTGDESNPILSLKENFRKLASRSWLTRMDHNHLRITRIIRCLRVLGLEEVAQAFFQALTDNAAGVGARSLMYWERAVSRPLHLPPDEPDEEARGVLWLREDAEVPQS